jgi:signal transduction histidine kinase
MTDEHDIARLKAELAEQQQALRQARAELDALRQQDAENADIIGDVIARMVHDLNNLNTKIRSSSSAILHALSDVRGVLGTVMLDLAPEQQQAFLALLERTCQQKAQAAERLSLREERRLRRSLYEELETWRVRNVDEVADLLVDMGIYADIHAFVPILRAEGQETFIQAVYGLASLHDVVRWNLNPTFGRIMHITHALRHLIVALLRNQARDDRIVPGIEQVLALFADQFEARQIAVSTQYDEIPPMRCYAGLEIVWANLVENAIEAIHADGTLDIQATRQPAGVEVRIIDSGCGIPESLQAVVFERNATTKPSGAEVHGAGLSMARTIVQKHQGRITFETRPGRTAFSVWLPFCHPATAADAA